MQQAFAIPIVDEIKNDGSEEETKNSEKEDIKECDEENNQDIQGIDTEDLDALFSYKTA